MKKLLEGFNITYHSNHLNGSLWYVLLRGKKTEKTETDSETKFLPALSSGNNNDSLVVAKIGCIDLC